MRWLRNNLHINILQQLLKPTWVGDALPSFPLLQKVPEETLGMFGTSGIGFNFALALPAVPSSLG